MTRVIRSALAAVLVLSAPLVARALVQPAPGSVLPDFDIRSENRPASGSGLVSDGGVDGTAPTPAPVLPSQRRAMERLRSAISPRLTLDLLPSNGLPRQLHAFGLPLSEPSTASPAAIARDFLKANQDLFLLTGSEVDALVVARDYRTHDTFRTLWLAQQVDGVEVDRAAIRFAIDPGGRIVWVSAGPVQPGLRVDAIAHLAPEAAILRAAEHIGVRLESAPRQKSTLADRTLVFERGPFLQDISVEPLIFPTGSGNAMRAWRVSLEPAGEMSAWYYVTVDARAGRLLERYNLYQYGAPATNAGLVFDGPYPNVPGGAGFPDGVAQTQHGFGYRWPSTVGWTIPAPYGTYTLTTGNNVEAKEDWLRDNETTVGRYADGGTLQEFLFPFTNAYRTSLGVTDAARIADHRKDVDAVTTNLFYWINNWHDYMHALGFDEAAGNFQHDNFSRGGCGRDAIFADAMDGAAPPTGGPSLNNANFATPPEAMPGNCLTSNSRPRMQQFVMRLGTEAIPTWLADTSLDAHVVIHEFSHGTSNRLVGGFSAGCMGGTQAGAMGEGFGDFYAASRFSDPLVGRWSFNGGLRQFPMDMNPRTYADLVDQVHSDGEIYSSTLWDVRRTVGGGVIEQLLTDAMKLAPCGPSFLDMRDALLLADALRYGGANRCVIWGAHLGRGMGFDAAGANSTYAVPDFQFDAPVCSGNAHLRYRAHTTSDVAQGNGDGLYGLGEIVDLLVELHNVDGASTATGVTATVTTTTPGVTVVAGTQPYPSIAVGASGNPSLPFQFRIDPGFVCGAPIDFTVSIGWAPGLSRPESFRDFQGSAPGISLTSHDVESAPLPLQAPITVSTAHNHTPGGSNSYWTLGGCYAGDEQSCGASPCDNTCGTITLPTLALPPSQAAWLSFWATYNVEFTWDGPYVQASTDGGASWEEVSTINYPSSVVGQTVGCGPDTTIGAINGPSDNASFVPWTRFEGDLTRFAGKTVAVRIASHTDGCVVFEGAYLDDFDLSVRYCQAGAFPNAFLSGKVNADGVNPVCTDADGMPDPGETIDVTVTVTNSGNLAANNLMGTLSTLNPNVTLVGSATQSFGNLAPGASAAATYRYDVGAVGVGCFEDAVFDLALTANGGAYMANLGFSETLRSDAAVASWIDGFEGTQPAWTPSLGPAGTASDFALRELDCLTGGGNRFFWATNVGMTPAVCSTGEPDYSPDSDSVLTSPPIDLGTAGMKLTRASWGSFGIQNTVQAPGFVEVSVDHDGDGIFTPIVNAPGGLGVPDVAGLYAVDIAQNPLGAPILAKDTAQVVRLRFRFRSGAADPGAGGDSIGMLIDDFQLDWQRCDVNACAPGFQGGARRSATTRSQSTSGTTAAPNAPSGTVLTNGGP